MGKEWQFRSASGGGSGSGGDGRREVGSPSGCLSVFYQIFDFHRKVPTKFRSAPNIFQPEDQNPPILKGIEAPRNSLEKDEPFLGAPCLSSAMKMVDNLHIPMGIQIKTRVETVRSSTSEYTSSPDYLSSPGAAKTPTLVARLMGLDLLPDTSFPSPPSSNRSSTNSNPPPKSHLKSIIETRSLPETPRISSSRKSDVDRRLSLQGNRDSVDRVGEIEVSGRSRIRFVKREIRDGDKVREKVKLIKEGVSRRFGAEITNRVKNGEIENRGFENRGLENEIVLLKAQKRTNRGDELGLSKYSVQLLEKEKHNQLILKKEFREKQNSKRNVIKNKQTEAFVRSNLGKNKQRDFVSEKKKCTRKTPLSNEFVKINGVSSSVLPVKKEPSFPPTKLPPKQKPSQVSGSHSPKSIAQLSSSSIHKYRQAPADKSTVQSTTPNRSNGAGSTTCAGPEFLQYIKDILILSGIDINTPILFTKLPVDPSIFNLLEMPHSHFTHRCNRKLIFEVVSELLEEIFRPFTSFKRWGFPKLNDYEICGSELIDKLSKKIKSFPSANCQVLEDIDALIDGDLVEIELQRIMVIEEEGLTVVEEIGAEILDNIVNEVAMEMI